jgi:hypothetical protein
MAEANALQVEKGQLAGSINSYRNQAEEAHKLLKHLSKGDFVQEFDDDIFLEFVDDITVLSRDKVVFNMKCGIKLPERLVN